MLKLPFTGGLWRTGASASLSKQLSRHAKEALDICLLFTLIRGDADCVAPIGCPCQLTLFCALFPYPKVGAAVGDAKVSVKAARERKKRKLWIDLLDRWSTITTFTLVLQQQSLVARLSGEWDRQFDYLSLTHLHSTVNCAHVSGVAGLDPWSAVEGAQRFNNDWEEFLA